jgi:hypothetical protein
MHGGGGLNRNESLLCICSYGLEGNGTRLVCLVETTFGKPAFAAACSWVDGDAAAAAAAAALLMLVQLRVQVQTQLRLPVLQPVS